MFNKQSHLTLSSNMQVNLVKGMLSSQPLLWLMQVVFFNKLFYPKKSRREGRFYFSFILLFFFSLYSTFAQVKDSVVNTDSLRIVIPSNSNLKIKSVYHSPKKSALMSTIIPGLGQVYNKKYWKVPIIYAGVVGLAYSINGNHTKYIQYRTAYIYRIDEDPSTIDDFPKYSDENLNTLQKYYHRSRNLSVIGATLLYIMNIVDASVDAHMFTFDVGDDLSLNIHPALINNSANLNNYTTGLSLNLKF